MAKLTKTPEGKIVPFATKRGRPDMCSETCPGVYRFKGELYCFYFSEHAFSRCQECVDNEVKEERKG